MDYQNLAQWGEVLLPLFSVIGIASWFILMLMGLLRRDSKQTCLDNIRKSSKEKTPYRLPILKKEVFFWKDPFIINSGGRPFIGICIFILWALYILFFIGQRLNEKLIPAFSQFFVGFTVFYCLIILMFSFGIKFDIKEKKQIKRKPIFIPCIASLILVGFSYKIIFIFNNFPKHLLFGQLIIFFIQNCIFSYILGIEDAIKEWKIESTPHKVEITTISGDKITGFYTETTTTDYRFISENREAEIIFPINQIKQIKCLD